MQEKDENSSQLNTNTELVDSQNSQSTGGVMDVTAPQSTAEDTPAPSPELMPSLGVDSSQSSENSQSISDNNAPLVESSTTTAQTDTAMDNSSTNQHAEETQTEQPKETGPKANKSPHHGMPIIAIIIAIIVAIALASLVILIYMRNGDGEIQRKDTNKSQTTTEKTDVGSGDVDKTNDEIDSALKQADDTVDFPEEELSDTSLGL